MTRTRQNLIDTIRRVPHDDDEYLDRAFQEHMTEAWRRSTREMWCGRRWSAVFSGIARKKKAPIPTDELKALKVSLFFLFDLICSILLCTASTLSLFCTSLICILIY
jgi:hypothetical protein